MQRLLELIIAKRNERWMKARGGREYGKKQYIFIVLVHVGFFISLFLEVTSFHKEISNYWPILLSLFLLAQLGRLWVITSLGSFWNTKIIVLPYANVVADGPYKWMKHPNYFIVTVEFILIPLLFQAYMTMLIFFLLNQLILTIRIPLEEKILREYTNFDKQAVKSNIIYLRQKRTK